MAEDKKIRVSADLTPLQELRQGAQALLDDINNMEGRFRRLSGKTLDTIQAQIDLLKERNRVADEFNPGKPILYPLTPGQAYRTPTGEKHGDPTVSTRLLEAVKRIGDILEAQFRNQQNGILPDDGNPDEGGGLIPPTTPSRGGGASNVRGGNVRFPTSMSGLMSMVPLGALIMGIGTILGKQAQFGATQYGAENVFQRQNNIGNYWLLNLLTFGASGAEAQRREVARMAASRNDLALRDYTSLHGISYESAVGSQLRRSYNTNDSSSIYASLGLEYNPDADQAKAVKEGRQSPWKGMFTRHAPGATASEDVDAALAFNGYTRKGEASLSTTSTSDSELRNWASDTLGLNITDYLQRVVGLQRAGVKGYNTSPEDINQLLVAQRIRGLSDEDLAGVQRTTRFGRGGMTGAGVVQAFDTNLQGFYRGMPDANQRIAATLNEYLDQFNRMSENLLSKTGSIEPENIVRSMTSIQNATGMEGRQLNRVQEALMGQNVAQDDVTQALLLRTAREINPNAQLSDLQAMVEQMPGDTELQEKFFTSLQRMTGGGEMMRQVMKAVFPGLSMTDIVDLDNGKIKLDELFKKGTAKGRKYSDATAQAMVGDAEASTAGTDNRKILDGISQTIKGGLPGLKEALESVEKPLPVMIVKAPPGSAGEDMMFNVFPDPSQLFRLLEEGIYVLRDILTEQKKPVEIPYRP